MSTQVIDAEFPRVESRRGTPMANVLRLRDFRLLWIGQGTSLLGDQFYLVALPWLVLRLTNDPLALGLVLACAGVPRAAFMLAGGALADRFSPRTVMLFSDAIRLVLVLLLAILVLTRSAQMWMLIALSLAFGLIAGLFMPASQSIVPALVSDRDLQAGNAVFQGTAQLSGFLGPVLAGGLIAWGGHALSGQADGAESAGIALAFALDAVSFAVSILTLWWMSPSAPLSQTGEQAEFLQAVRRGIGYAWQQPLLRILFAIIAAMNLFMVGPVMIGIPVLASTRLPEGAAAFGLILSGYAGGAMLGFVFAGTLPRLKRLGLITPLLLALFGLGFLVLSHLSSTWAAFGVLLVLGMADGYLGIIVITWMQNRTPRELLGRVMSLLLFFNVGLLPLSEALSGAISKWSVSGLFVGAGACILAVALGSAFLPELKKAEF